VINQVQIATHQPIEEEKKEQALVYSPQPLYSENHMRVFSFLDKYGSADTD
jgi:hypothetical protein